ncbi:MAG: GNAT family N-acetyltransferase [Gaiellaceae bacterium]
MQVERHGDAESFLADAGGFLMEREAEHNLILGITSRLRVDPRAYGQDPYFAVARDGGDVVAATMRTPPHNLILSEVGDEAALEPLAADANDVFQSLTGVVGPKAAVARLAEIWEARTGQPRQLMLRQRSYCAEQVLEPEGVAGTMRPYEERDRELVLGWMDAFVEEALPEAPPEDSARWLERRAADPDSGTMIWEDGEPVSMGGYGGLTPNGIRVGPIYTPPELRRRGYATALTAAMTRMLLEGGRRFCFLFTDLANPTSNSIYQRIGYRPVTDVDQWSFR